MNTLEYSMELLEKEFYELIDDCENFAYIFRLISDYRALECMNQTTG